MGDLLIASLSGASGRQAVIEESAGSVWLYMTAPNGEKPIADCFLFNTGEAAVEGEGPPPLDPQFQSAYRVRQPVTDDDVKIVWSIDGNSVAARIHDEFVGFIGPDDLQGYSRSVNQHCEWAHPFDVERFNELFRSNPPSKA